MTIINKNKVKLLGIILNCFCFTVYANVTLPAFVSDGMVLQRAVEIPIWGWADRGEKIKVTFKEKTYSTTATDEGKWDLVIASQKAGGPYTMIINGKNKVIISDILIGDVWICSGQSNMVMQMGKLQDRYAQDIAASANKNIRQFKVEWNTSFAPLDDVTSEGWKTVDPVSILKFTAAGYFFAEAIYDHYSVPVGLINTSWGGTPAQAWMSLDGLKQFPHYVERFSALKKKYGGTKKKNIREILKSSNIYLQREPANLYNAMIAPLIPYAVKGVIWYQGESNARRPHEYDTLFPALIHDWRNAWSQEFFPFIYVQLPNFRAPAPTPQKSAWALIREAQFTTLSVKNTGMAVTIDIGDAERIHPLNKKDVGLRLALAARKVAYKDKKIVYSGPVYHSMEEKGGKIYIQFSHIGSGLIAKGDTGLKHFAIAGTDRKFVQANAKIEGDRVVVWNDSVTSPVAVRYAWADNPEGCNLYNKEGLPASPFRSDDWKW